MIRIDDNYYIETDSYNVILRYENQVEKVYKGELRAVNQSDKWYYTTIPQALKAYLNKSLKESSSIENILHKVNFVENKINNLKLNTK